MRFIFLNFINYNQEVMVRIFLFVILFIFSFNSFGQVEFSPKFKPIAPLKEKPKKENTVALPTSPKFDLPQIVVPNIFKETNIFGTKSKPNSSFQIGIPENIFSMTLKNKFEHKLGDVYKAKMTKDLDKTMVREELKFDKSLLDRVDRYLGQYNTKSEFFVLNYRDYIEIDGDLINVYVNNKLLRSGLYLNFEFGELRIPLSVGINNIELVVASTGTSGGNTAEIHFLDDKKSSITQQYWNNLALGVKIKTIVIRE
jgi:hypothetical protein